MADPQRGPSRREALAACALTFALGTGARAATRVRPSPGPTKMQMKIAVIPGDVAALPYYARENGLFEKAGLDVEIRTTTDAVAMRGSVATEGIDVAYDTIVAAAIAHAKDPPFVIVAPANEYTSRAPATGLLVVKRTSPLRSAADLGGKTIAVDAVAGLAALGVRRWVDAHGGDSTLLTFVELPMTKMGDALRTGHADAASVDRAVVPSITLDTDPLRVLANTFDAIGGRWLPAAWQTTPAWIVRHPDEAQAFAGAMKESAEWANAHHPESAEILAKMLKLPVERIAAAPRAQYATTVTPALIEPVIDVCVRYKVIPETFPATDLIDPLAR